MLRHLLPALAAALALASCAAQPVLAQSYNGGQLPDGLTYRGAVAAGDVIPCQPNGSPTVQGCLASDVAAYTLTSVKAFGAKGDGVTDDTAAIQAALNSGEKLSCSGIYHTTATLTMSSAANAGQQMAGAGPQTPSGPTAGRCIIQPAAGVSPAITIDGTPISSWLLGVKLSDLTVDMVNESSGAIGIYLGQSFDGALTRVDVINAAPSTGKISIEFGPGNYTTHLDTINAGLLKWAGNGSDNPTTTECTNCDVQAVSINQASQITFYGGAIQPPYYSGQTLVYLAANAETTPIGLSNGSGLYLIEGSSIINADAVSFVGTDIEGGGGYPSTTTDGTHGTLSAYPVLYVASTATRTAFVPGHLGSMYAYDLSSSSLYTGINLGGGAPGFFVNTPMQLAQGGSVENGSILGGQTGVGIGNTWSLNASTGAATFLSELIQPATDADGVIRWKSANGTYLMDWQSGASGGGLNLDNCTYLTGYSDTTATLAWQFACGAGGNGVLTLKGGGSTTITLTGTNGTIVATGGINSTSIGAAGASAGAFTTLSASSTVSGAGFASYLASPPAIGGTVPAAVTGTTINATTGYQAGGTAGVTCSGTPTSSFASKNGIVTHC